MEVISAEIQNVADTQPPKTAGKEASSISQR